MPVSSPPPADPASSGSVLGARGNGALSHPLPAGMRDLLPEEARRQHALVREVLGSFERFGYEPVSVPPFEYAEVLEHDMGPLDPAQVLRFVEPETGEVVALRPDMTPQIARLVAMRLGDAPLPVRLCYEGAVVRRRVERARRERQIHQAGFELVGLTGPGGDLEVLEVASSAIVATGLTAFTLDLGHARVAPSLVQNVPERVRGSILEALSAKDAEETRRRAEKANVKGRELAALVELPGLYGGRDVFERADRILAGTAAEAPAKELRALAEQVDATGLAAGLVVDLGETWNVAYYTGMAFRVLADGPGEAIGSGGRYDRLFDRFGTSRAAAGFAIDVGNLGWALATSNRAPAVPNRVLVASADRASERALLAALRGASIPCAAAPGGDAPAYARAHRYTHVVELSGGSATLISVESGERRPLPEQTPRDLGRALRALLADEPRSNEDS
ncbi:MAG TPA: ATP phosphoribosyltransferase regulatory subunit [Polyangiaceae bacterium]|nr:ATP phosphoribosyltransferase regulatory subunit [Polyangiaceae bacterium]